jgi:hypothetical protein
LSSGIERGYAEVRRAPHHEAGEKPWPVFDVELIVLRAKENRDAARDDPERPPQVVDLVREPRCGAQALHELGDGDVPTK